MRLIRKTYLSLPRFASILFVLVLLGSCKQEKVKVYSNFYQYYPLKVGNYLIYNADSIRYTNSSVAPIADTIRYQLMDSVQSKFIDGTGQTVYRIQESRRANSMKTWQIVRVFTRSSNTINAQEVDGNIRYIKLIFPIEANRQWNPDIYNTIDSSNANQAQYIQVHQPYSFQNLQFDSTVLVQLQSDSTLINWNVYNERYAAEIGLIAVQSDSVYETTTGIPGSPVSFSGFRFNQNLSDYGPR